MSKLAEKCDRYEKELKEKIGLKSVDRKLLDAVAKACGPSIYKADAEKVACSDKKELERVKKNFLIKKLELKDTPKLDEALAEVCASFGKSRNKFRAMVYYLLVKKFRKTKMFVA
jgi:hypothetical protein